MGMERIIELPAGGVPAWATIREQLHRVGEVAVLRMIDGLPAFPDEIPEPGWKELRVGLSAGMVTLRTAPQGLLCVVWGNADPSLRTSWDKLCWAAAAVGGTVQTPSGPLDATAFAQSVGLTPT